MYTDLSSLPLGVVREDHSAPRMTFRLISVSICLLAALSFFLIPLPAFQWGSDYWEHASALRVLSESPFSPTNPHYASNDPDRQFIPLFVLLGWLMNVTGMGVTTALAVSGTITTVLLCIGVGMFSRAYFQHRCAPVIMIAVLLCGWGNPWVWTGFYELRCLFHTNYYPAAFDFSLTFIAWALLIRALRSDTVSLPTGIALPVLAALMFVTHQLGGLFALGGAALFLLFEPYGSTRTRMALFLLLAAGLAATWWWPYFNPIELMVRGSGDKQNEGVSDFYNVIQVLLLVGPAWIGLPILWQMARKKTCLALVFGFAGLMSAYVIGGIAGHPVAHRFLSYTVVYLHLPIVWKILSLNENWARGRSELASRYLTWPRVRAAGMLLVLVQIAFGSVDFVRVAYEKQTGKSFGRYPSYNILPELNEATQDVPMDAVMFASSDPSLSVTALKGKVVARPRPQLMIGDGEARRSDNARFFAASTSESDRRSLIRKYGASYILIRKENIPVQVTAQLAQLGTVIHTTDQLIMIKIDTPTAS
ncbi:MAG: hypothetical protein ACXV7F_10635 [Methylomonas sp.]